MLKTDALFYMHITLQQKVNFKKQEMGLTSISDLEMHERKWIKRQRDGDMWW